MQKKYTDFLSFAHFLSDVASKELINNYKQLKVTSSKKIVKKKFELVTDIDLKIEKKIRALIERYFPHHSIIGEEFENKKTNSEFSWIIDPIDGTKAFATGIPVFGFLLSLKHYDKNIIGLVDLPILKERFWNNGNKAFLNGKLIKTKACNKISKAIVASTEPNMFKNFNKINKDIFSQFDFMRWGTDITGYLRCAEGFIDAVIERNIKIWDIAAVESIIKSAGGSISTWDGKPIGSNDTVCASGDKKLHTILLKSLQKFI